MNRTDHLPVIHSNGTPKAKLVTIYADAIDAIHAAGDKLKLTAPNGRDYYLAGNMERAEFVFKDRMDLLRNLIRWLEADMLAIDRPTDALTAKETR